MIQEFKYFNSLGGTFIFGGNIHLLLGYLVFLKKKKMRLFEIYTFTVI